MSGNEDAVVMRGHHLLCVHGFAGMGYSPAFVQQMGDLVARVRDEGQDFPIRVRVGQDAVCRACPHDGGEACVKSETSDHRVKEMDRRVLHHLHLADGDVLRKAELLRVTAERVTPQDLDRLCAGCSWLPLGVCKAGIERLGKG